MATAKEPEFTTKSSGYVVEMKLREEYAEREYRHTATSSKMSRRAVMLLLVIDTSKYYRIPKKEVSLEMVRCRFIISQGFHMFEDCYCEWCDGTPKAGEQGSGRGRRKFGCRGKYLKDT
ncbi:hypothetical protein BOTCAL_0031g00140 [Botryotinia calthae]|uniref:Uncharacterized protein n=1 Tax=Botryotinia calthae TaxID=38488 RepID=A0A4Y8DDG4_9HELO|nr:hypothetical protein BOTCAL_0031g00140 [Botryotinia calthae]